MAENFPQISSKLLKNKRFKPPGQSCRDSTRSSARFITSLVTMFICSVPCCWRRAMLWVASATSAIALIASCMAVKVALMVVESSALRCANFRTSSATTVNPRPASPTLMTSIVALNARSFVCLVTLLIDVIISSILDKCFNSSFPGHSNFHFVLPECERFWSLRRLKTTFQSWKTINPGRSRFSKTFQVLGAAWRLLLVKPERMTTRIGGRQDFVKNYTDFT